MWQWGRRWKIWELQLPGAAVTKNAYLLPVWSLQYKPPPSEIANLPHNHLNTYRPTTAFSVYENSGMQSHSCSDLQMSAHSCSYPQQQYWQVLGVQGIVLLKAFKTNKIPHNNNRRNYLATETSRNLAVPSKHIAHLLLLLQQSTFNLQLGSMLPWTDPAVMHRFIFMFLM